MMARSIIACLLALPLLAGAATVPAEGSPEAVVDRYIAAISASDWDAMAELLADDAHYEDRTMAYFARGAVDLRGPEAITGFWRDSAASAGSGAIRYERRGGFAAGPVVVLTLRVFVDNDGAAWDMPGTTFTGEMDVISLIEVRDGRVAWHMDAADYSSAMRQVETLQRAYEAGAEARP